MRKISQTIAMSIALCGLAGFAFAQSGSIQSKKLPTSFLKKLTPKSAHSADPSFTAGRVKYLPNGTKITSATSLATTGLPGVDSLTNWSDQFTSPASISSAIRSRCGLTPWWALLRNRARPQSSARRLFPLTVDLLGPDGKVAMFNGHPLTFTPTPQIIKAIVGSPVFQPWFYTSGVGQFNDQAYARPVLRTVSTGNNWHNLLAPVVRQAAAHADPLRLLVLLHRCQQQPGCGRARRQHFQHSVLPRNSCRWTTPRRSAPRSWRATSLPKIFPPSRSTMFICTTGDISQVLHPRIPHL